MTTRGHFPKIWPNYGQTMAKIWPSYGQDWDIKEKKDFAFSLMWSYLQNLFWCPEQDLNLHSFRNTHLKRARLPIPPPGLVGLLPVGA